MGTIAIVALRAVIALSLIGSLAVQILMTPLAWADLEGAPSAFRISLIGMAVLLIGTVQVSAICVWRLLTLVRRGSVFSPAAFRYVNVIIGAVATASVLTFAVAVLLAPGDVAPGVVGLICGASLVIAGVALIVFVLRLLLAQAVDRDAEARGLRAELDEVI